MSRNSKNARVLAKARDITKLHQNGEKAPARTTPQHGKKWGYRTNPDTLKRIAEAASPEAQEKTSGRRILRGAGAASRGVENVDVA